MENTDTRAHAIPGGAADGEGLVFEQRTVSLADCRYGRDHPLGAINPRKTDRGASAELVATIRESGVLEPLLGTEHEGLIYFEAGDRRLNALFRIHAAARRAPDDPKGGDYPIVFESVRHVPVPVILHHRGDPLARGLQENLNRNNLHPLDKMEGFAALLARGRSEAEIAAAFSLRPAQVKQSLRLGVLAPAIRDAWRDGTLDAPTAESFTLCKNEKQQLKIFERLTKDSGPGARLTPHQVRKALKAQPGEVKRLLAFVGRDVYEAEGFTIGESMFSLMGVVGEGDDAHVIGEPVVSDLPALRALAERRLDVEAARLTSLSKAEGGPWAWAKRADQMPRDWQSWPRMTIEHPKIKDRASVGCVVSIDGEGCLVVEEKIYWSQSDPAADRGRPTNPTIGSGEDGGNAADEAAPITGTTTISDVRFGDTPIEQIPGAQSGTSAPGTSDWANADLPPRLQQQLAEQLQAGLAQALGGRNDMALPLLLAGLASGGEVIGISRLDARDGTGAYPFEEALEQYAAMDLGAQLRNLASVVAASLSLTIASGQVPPAFMPGPKMLLRITAKLMGQRGLKKHLVQAFEVEGYVKAAPKPQLLMAIGECCGEAQATKMEAKGIVEIRKFASVHLAEQKWLPPEITGGMLDTPKPAAKRPAPKPVKGRVKKAAARAKSAPRKTGVKKRGRR